MSSTKLKSIVHTLVLGTLSLGGAEGALAYCSSSGSNSSYEWIESVTIGSDVRTTGNNNGYGDFTQNAIYLSIGSNTLALQPGFGGYNYTENWKVWIDFNGDDSFTDDEAVYSSASNSTIHGAINIPASVPGGETRMRISMRYAGSPAPCGGIGYGEVEDYQVYIDTVDSTSPDVVSVTPSAGAAEVSVAAPIAIEFSEEIDPASVSINQFMLAGVAGQVSGELNVNGDTLSFTPDAALDYSSSYTATVYAGLTDFSGNPLLTDHSWSFSTETPDMERPEILNLFPDAGSTRASINSSVQAFFSEAIDPLTVNNSSITVSDGVNQVAGTVFHSGAQLALYPDPLEYSTTYTVTISPDVCDLAGNCLDEPYSWTFTTEEWQPSYCSSWPDPSWEWVKSVRVRNYTFSRQSQPVDGYSDDTSIVFELSKYFPSSLELTPGFASTWGHTVYWSVYIDWNNDGVFGNGETAFQGSGNSKVSGQITIPSFALPGYTRMRVAVRSSGYPPACSFASGFVQDVTVHVPEPAPDTTAPQVTSTSPADGAQSVAVNETIAAEFSEAIDAQTLDTASFTVSEMGIPLAGEVTYDPQNQRAFFTPDQDLAHGATYTATLSSSIADPSGNPLAGDYSWSFTTDAESVPTVALSGQVTFSETGLPGVSIELVGGGSSFSVFTTEGGGYTLPAVPAGSYTITASKPGYVFSPESMGVVVEDANLSGLDFTADVATEVLVNGDFETGDFTGFDSYKTEGGEFLKQIVGFDADNDGNSSLVAKVVVGASSTYNPEGEGGGLTQTFSLNEGDLYVTMDIAASGNNGSGGLVQIYLDNELMDSHDFGSINGNEYAQLSFYVPSVSAGAHTLGIHITRPYLVASAANYLDDIVVSGTSTQQP